MSLTHIQRRGRRLVWLAALGCGLGGGTALAQAPASPTHVGYADPSGLGRPTTTYLGWTHTQDLPACKVLPQADLSELASFNSEATKPLPIDLPYALRLVNASNPTIAIANVRVQEAYARLQQANVSWIPNLWAGGNPDNLTYMPTYAVHNGILQNSRGQIFDVVKASASFPVGTGLNLSLADAIFLPRIARNLVAAERARAQVVTSNVQLDVALTYLDLLRVYGALAINAESRAQAELMLDTATQAAKQDLGKTTADVNRARTEVEIRRQERIELEGEAGIVSARLSQLLLLDSAADLIPADAAVLPIELVPAQNPIEDLIAVGLLNRPELAESRAQVAAALARWREDKTRPLIPTVQLAYYGAQFGGGTPALHDYGFRNDFFIQASWQLRHGGLGDLYTARESRARYAEANLHVTEIEAEIGAEVSSAVKMSLARQRELDSAQEAVTQAEAMWAKLKRAAFGLAAGVRRYDPIEPLLAEQALHEARMRYLSAVIDYNRNQFRLYWALGQPPLSALPCASALPVRVPVTPSRETIEAAKKQEDEKPKPE
jgi:outer membrane protein TolC